MSRSGWRVGCRSPRRKAKRQVLAQRGPLVLGHGCAPGNHLRDFARPSRRCEPLLLDQVGAMTPEACPVVRIFTCRAQVPVRLLAAAAGRGRPKRRARSATSASLRSGGTAAPQRIILSTSRAHPAADRRCCAIKSSPWHARHSGAANVSAATAPPCEERFAIWTAAVRQRQSPQRRGRRRTRARAAACGPLQTTSTSTRTWSIAFHR